MKQISQVNNIKSHTNPLKTDKLMASKRYNHTLEFQQINNNIYL